jgi:hypothetical protein
MVEAAGRRSRSKSGTEGSGRRVEGHPGGSRGSGARRSQGDLFGDVPDCIGRTDPGRNRAPSAYHSLAGSRTFGFRQRIRHDIGVWGSNVFLGRLAGRTQALQVPMHFPPSGSFPSWNRPSHPPCQPSRKFKRLWIRRNRFPFFKAEGTPLAQGYVGTPLWGRP